MSKPDTTQKAANYRDHPNGQQRCGLCTMFVNGGNPGSCTKVMGKISPRGWCKYFEWKKSAK